jgi:hypothetical protein
MFLSHPLFDRPSAAVMLNQILNRVARHLMWRQCHPEPIFCSVLTIALSGMARVPAMGSSREQNPADATAPDSLRTGAATTVRG